MRTTFCPSSATMVLVITWISSEAPTRLIDRRFLPSSRPTEVQGDALERRQRRKRNGPYIVSQQRGHHFCRRHGPYGGLEAWCRKWAGCGLSQLAQLPDALRHGYSLDVADKTSCQSATPGLAPEHTLQLVLDLGLRLSFWICENRRRNPTAHCGALRCDQRALVLEFRFKNSDPLIQASRLPYAGRPHSRGKRARWLREVRHECRPPPAHDLRDGPQWSSSHPPLRTLGSRRRTRLVVRRIARDRRRASSRAVCRPRPGSSCSRHCRPTSPGAPVPRRPAARPPRSRRVSPPSLPMRSPQP